MLNIEQIRKVGLAAVADTNTEYTVGFAAGIDWLYNALTSKEPTGAYKEPCRKK